MDLSSAEYSAAEHHGIQTLDFVVSKVSHLQWISRLTSHLGWLLPQAQSDVPCNFGSWLPSNGAES